MTVLHIKLAQETGLSFRQPENAETPRQFTGIAHSGQVFTKWGDRYIVDLSNIQYRAKTGVLLEHDPNQKVGVGALSVSPQGLQIDGTLLSTEQGKHVADTSDEGYPWELSAYIQSARQEQLREGEMVVNGVTVAAPIVILRDCAVREVSFVAVGADTHTNAVVLSDGTDFKPDFSLSNENHKENTMTEAEQAEFDALKAKVAELETENADLKKAQADADKKSKVDKKLSDAGLTGANQVSEQVYGVLLSLNDTQADALIVAMKLSGQTQTKPPLPTALTQDTPPTEGEMKLSAAQADKPTLGGYPII
ncbi:hypothetical protein [Wielerella bovis]|uniref:hypothetical protein n=1 Tax=Wielerella bovis TaxID=2917790 RepID=UPI00201920BE|nr:hypothetical protein [Wielerella bovis]ULJ61060.1 hypothetical protein MIS44_04180 [Wielerella bovis]